MNNLIRQLMGDASSPYAKETPEDWTPRQKRVFARLFERMLKDQQLYQHPQARVKHEHWKTTAWNLAWTVANELGQLEGELWGEDPPAAAIPVARQLSPSADMERRIREAEHRHQQEERNRAFREIMDHTPIARRQINDLPPANAAGLSQRITTMRNQAVGGLWPEHTSQDETRDRLARQAAEGLHRQIDAQIAAGAQQASAVVEITQGGQRVGEFRVNWARAPLQREADDMIDAVAYGMVRGAGALPQAVPLPEHVEARMVVSPPLAADAALDALVQESQAMGAYGPAQAAGVFPPPR